MSTLEGFRISVNLSHFFSDHRSGIRLFVGKDMKKIKDIENKIKNIFGVENIRLTSQNEYLPSEEDARILRNDEVIWVLPTAFTPTNLSMENSSGKNINNHQVHTNLSSSKNSNTVENSPTNRSSAYKSFNLSAKKFRKQLDEVIEDSESSFSAKKKKKKHSKEKLIDSTVKDQEKGQPSTFKSANLESGKNKVLLSNSLEPSPSKSNNKVSKSHNNTEPKVDKNKCKTNKSPAYIPKLNIKMPVLQLINGKKKKKKSSVNNEDFAKSSSTGEISDDYVCKGDLASYKKNTPVPTITDQYLKQTKTNIVKIDVVNKATLEQKNNPEESSCMKHIINKKNSLDFSHDYLDNISSKCLKDGQSDNNQLSTVTSDSADADEKEAKIKQKTSGLTEKNLIKPNLFFFDALDKSAKKEENSAEMAKDPSQMFKATKVNMNTDSTSLKPRYFFYNSPRTSILSQNIDNNIQKEITKNCEIHLEQQNTSDHVERNGRQETDMPVRSQRNQIHTNIENHVANEILVENKSDADNCGDNKNTNKNLKNLETIADNCNYQNPKVVIISPSFIDTTYKTPEISLSTDLSSGMLSGIGLDATAPMSFISTVKSSTDISGLQCLSPGSYSPLVAKKKTKEYLGVGSLIEGLRNSNSSWDTVESDTSKFVTKKRKRTRKRKRNASTTNTAIHMNDTTSSISSSTPKTMNVKACPIMHVKFDYSQDQERADVINVIQNEVINQGKDENVDVIHVNDETNEIVNLTKNEIENCTEVVEYVTINSTVDEDTLTLKDILKAPIMTDLLPKVGDIISFKVLKMTDDYTPEVSSFITGKVLQFKDKQVVFNIVSGLDQCKDPIGKLSLSNEETITESQQMFYWHNLFEPRLIFP